MSRLLSLLILFYLALLLSVQFAGATATLRVDEASTRILLEDKQTLVWLVVENSLGRSVGAHIKIELIDPEGRRRCIAERDEIINPGIQQLRLPLVFLSAKDQAEVGDEFLWYRLRYHISQSASSETRFDETSGVIALSEITPDFFELHLTAPRVARENLVYRALVRAVHPLSSQPVKDVNVQAFLTFQEAEGNEVPLKLASTTGVDGYATFYFKLPRNIVDEVELKIIGRRGILNKQIRTEVDLDNHVFGVVDTDKPLYQPGQILHARVLAFDRARRALANEEVTLKISDPEGETVLRTTLQTSRFGIGSADWPIPENTRLGDYELEVTFENPKYEDSRSAGQVKISRYDLPIFNVSIKPNNSHYLPGQNAEIEVRADYLFGQPVKRGHVRVVRETERRWNYAQQKWETEEADKYEGDTDSDGRFIAHVNLSAAHKELAEQDYSRFRDLSYAAYFTDPTTNRTEQRRFDLRITKDAIHVYFVEGPNSQTKGFPLQFYVSTYYADGTPASCDLTISEGMPASEGMNEKPLRTIRTNRFGVAKVTDVSPTVAGDSAGSELIQITARDDKGKTGHHTEDIYYRDTPVIRIETDKVFYRPGQPVRVKINASRPDMQVVVDTVKESKVLQSQLAQLRDGHASLTIPYMREFKDDVTIAVYAVDEPDSSEYDFPFTTRTIIYPRNRDLRLDVDLNKSSYRPGEDASISFLTRAANGNSTESALGVVIFDKATEERARTDREFGSYGFYSAYSFLQGGTDAIAGVTRKDLDRVDPSKPVPEDFELVAQMLLSNNWYLPVLLKSSEYETSAAKVFATPINDQLKPLIAALNAEYKNRAFYPVDRAALDRLLSVADLRLDDLRDPWDRPYLVSFFVDEGHDVLELESTGADKRPGTTDDFGVLQISRPYFRFTGEAIDRAAVGYHVRTGNFIRDAATLKSELLRQGIHLDDLRDPWGQPYRVEFDVAERQYSIKVRSGGPDRKFLQDKNNDDFTLWTSLIDYSTELSVQIDRALDAYFKATTSFPTNPSELRTALSQIGLDLAQLLDPWGHQFYITFNKNSRYADHATIISQAQYGYLPKEKTEITPVTQTVVHLQLRCAGPDAKEGTADDFTVASFSRIVAEQSRANHQPNPGISSVVLQGSTGAITGTVTDLNGASVPGATVTAINRLTAVEHEANTNDSGVYSLKNLPAGIYDLRFAATAFKDAVITDVRVRSSSVMEVNVILEAGTVAETVTVTAGAENIQTTSASIGTTRKGSALPGASQVSTPRLREYFPETLLWQPALETDARGRAQLKFKLADNITTWKMSVIGSTEDGQIGAVEKEFVAFQPFFVEHDPPQILTEGDEIVLPIVVRNYLDSEQSVEVAIKPEPWFTLLGPAIQNAIVGMGEAERKTFELRATASVKDGKQRITARGITSSDAADAIEKPITVHPDGQEFAVTASNIANQSVALQFNIPEQTIANSHQATLKIYPNLMAHVIEGIEAIMERPYGCGEQTISSTYPSLLLLRHHKLTGQEFSQRTRAERYLLAGYNRLLNYRVGSGGFSYWSGDAPDLALTAYALRFLTDARDLIEVDNEVIDQTRAWLLKQQSSDGSWPGYMYSSRVPDDRRTALTTAYVARVLAMLESENDRGTAQNNASTKQNKAKVDRAFDYLSRRINKIDEPYLLASYALGLLEIGDTLRFESVARTLRNLSHSEGELAYWALETNTPFYGWGLAGRIETTALVLQALARSLPAEAEDQSLTPPAKHQRRRHAGLAPIASSSQTIDPLVRSGLLFLLKQKDRYGVWHSTQATINVFDALLALLARDSFASSSSQKISASPTAEIVINGRATQTVRLPAAGKLTSPIVVDISRLIQTGINRVEIRLDGVASPASAQVIATYYVPWSNTASAAGQHSSELRLATRFDKTQGSITEEITCHVEVERVGLRGHGMLLAEIGLPPGAEVDRASLETAMKNSDWAITQYDVLPDRVIVYLWPRAGSVAFDFKFRPRFGLQAKTAPSAVYDYYNAEARAVVAPTAFIIR